MSTTRPAPGLGGEGELLQVPLSALEHYAYCPRQCGLILLEDAFEDDAATIRGTLLHQRVDTPGNRGRGTVRTLHALPVWHDGYGLTGICDTVEIHADGRVLPIEHKSGRYHPGGPADIQATAQALCLEEMFHRPVAEAAVYSAADRRRHPVIIDGPLRDTVLRLTETVRALLTSARLPAPVADTRCRRCSMATGCMPKVLTGTRRYHRALDDLYHLEADPESA
ncbi:CRISPR-associated protein Cas4 [Streptomyces sp. TRM 70351]|uniref:CRISPR-associated protein Cas4 n=1 Tax=Streptomyces sp. TRM 70351 TaxID=3116552 RepID=UPI002E7B4550|nr:CRISPR-associated protein Cas4 [Streptomyces sp. TRM 70351]MEE1928313.1 CRISPR-associated protein Cas4 [Streptomyces sp. TRM 70351]